MREEHQDEFGYGDVYTWVSIDAETKLVPAWYVARRDGHCAYEFIKDLADRLAHRVQITTDGFKAYLNPIEEVFGTDVDYAMLIKVYGGEQTETRYSPAECLGTMKERIMGDPDPSLVSTSYVERQNFTMRMCMRRFTRLTTLTAKRSRITSTRLLCITCITTSPESIPALDAHQQWPLALAMRCGLLKI